MRGEVRASVILFLCRYPCVPVFSAVVRPNLTKDGEEHFFNIQFLGKKTIFGVFIKKI